MTISLEDFMSGEVVETPTPNRNTPDYLRPENRPDFRSLRDGEGRGLDSERVPFVNDSLVRDDYNEFVSILRNPNSTEDDLQRWGARHNVGAVTNAAALLRHYRQYPDAPVPEYYNRQAPAAAPEAPDSAGNPGRIGLGSRGLLTGVASIADIPASALSAVGNLITDVAQPGRGEEVTGPRLSPSPFRDAANAAGDALGWATPEGSQERIGNAIVEGGAQALTTFGIGTAMQGGQGATRVIGDALMDYPAANVAANITGNTAGEVVQQNGGGPVAQMAALLLAGGVSAAAVARIERLAMTSPRAAQAIERALANNDTRFLEDAGINANDIPAGTTPDSIAQAVSDTRGFADEAAAFQGNQGYPRGIGEEPSSLPQVDQDLALMRELGLGESHFNSIDDLQRAAAAYRKSNPMPQVGDRIPTPEEFFGESVSSRDASALEASLRAQAGDRIQAPAPEPVVEVAPEGGISKRQANELFRNELNARPVETQTPAQWGKDLQAQADEFMAGRQAETPPPAPEPARPVTPPRPAPDTATPAPEAPAPVDTPTPVETPSVPVANDVVTRLTAALQRAGKATAEQAELYRVERAQRFARAREAQAAGGGREAYKAALAAFKGEYKKADFAAVQDQFTPEEIGSLFDHISQSNLSVGQKTAAHAGLDNVLTGRVPQPAQIQLLSDVFGADFVKATLRNRSALQKAGSILGDIWNAPKSLQSTADLSAPLRQGIGLVHTRAWWKSLGPMIKGMADPATAARYEREIAQHPNHDLAVESGLSITTGRPGGVHEDYFNSRLAENIPGWGRVVRGSERAYVTFLNKLRFDTFNSLLDTAVRLGHRADNPEVARGISNYINIMTGRGSLGALEPAANVLNNAFYSARMISSRLQILTAPVAAPIGRSFIAELPRGMRVEAAKSYAGIIGVNSTLLGLASLAGLSVSLDPLSSDFMKAKDGNTRIDLGGGLTQYIVAGARAVMRQKTTSGENGTTSDLEGQGNTPLDNDLRLIMNKLHPSLTLILDQQRGADTVGEPFEWQTAILNRITPMGLPDIVQTLREHGGNPGALYSVLGLLGASLSNYQSGGDPAPEEPEATTETLSPATPSEGEISMEDFMAGETIEPVEATTETLSPATPSEGEISMEDFMAGETIEPVETPSEASEPPAGNLTWENGIATEVLNGLGAYITDNGVRSAADQRRYAATTNGVAAPGRSLHEQGNAIDIRVPQDLTEDDIISELENAGFNGVSIITKRHGTGPHWHIQWSSLSE